MRSVGKFILMMLALIVSGCGRSAETHWKDGNFKVYATDLDFEATKLGYDHHPGILGIVEAEVVAAGSDSKFVVVERFSERTGARRFYIVKKDSESEMHSGKSEGPFTREEFDQLKAERNLPEFSWRK